MAHNTYRVYASPPPPFLMAYCRGVLQSEGPALTYEIDRIVPQQDARRFFRRQVVRAVK